MSHAQELRTELLAVNDRLTAARAAGLPVMDLAGQALAGLFLAADTLARAEGVALEPAELIGTQTMTMRYPGTPA